MKQTIIMLISFIQLFSYTKGWELKGALQNIDITNNLFQSEGNIKIPYSLIKYQNVLNNAKLQAPLSSYNPEYSVKYGKFATYYNKFFYLTNNKYMTFYMCDKHHRSELRFKNEWQVETNTSKILNVKVKILPSNNVDEFTFLQIHTDSNKEELDKPLLRIAWIKNRKNITNHIWAVIMTNTSSIKSTYKYIDLGKLLKIFFNIKIEVINSKLSVWFNKTKKVNNFNISYWNGIKNYFKLGVYLQSNGCAKALFDIIEMKLTK